MVLHAFPGFHSPYAAMPMYTIFSASASKTSVMSYRRVRFIRLRCVIARQLFPAVGRRLARTGNKKTASARGSGRWIQRTPGGAAQDVAPSFPNSPHFPRKMSCDSRQVSWLRFILRALLLGPPGQWIQRALVAFTVGRSCFGFAPNSLFTAFGHAKRSTLKLCILIIRHGPPFSKVAPRAAGLFFC